MRSKEEEKEGEEMTPAEHDAIATANMVVLPGFFATIEEKTVGSSTEYAAKFLQLNNKAVA